MSSKKVAILQSSYIPWKGYFDLISSADEFILFDDMQFTRRDWRNRNRIKAPQGSIWLTIPVNVKGRYNQKINETTVSDKGWAKVHWKTIARCYKKAPYFQEYENVFKELYLNCEEILLSRINYKFITTISNILNIGTKLSWSSDYGVVEGKTERLVDLCKKAGATSYLSGPSARGYIDEKLFRNEQIELQFIDYDGYPEYSQLYPPFDHAVSIIDLIFNVGQQAFLYMRRS